VQIPFENVLICPKCKEEFVEIIDSTTGTAPDLPAPAADQPSVDVIIQEFVELNVGEEEQQEPQSQKEEMEVPKIEEMISPTNETSSIPPSSSIPVIPSTPPSNLPSSPPLSPRPVGAFASFVNSLVEADFGAHGINNFFLASVGIPTNPRYYSLSRSIEDLLNSVFNSGGRHGNPPASSKAIESLSTVKIILAQVANNEDCSICKDEFCMEEEVTQMPCQHLFHGECLSRWLKMHNQCPVCRFELETNDNYYERNTRISRSESQLQQIKKFIPQQDIQNSTDMEIPNSTETPTG